MHRGMSDDERKECRNDEAVGDSGLRKTGGFVMTDDLTDTGRSYGWRKVKKSKTRTTRNRAAWQEFRRWRILRTDGNKMSGRRGA